ncbi:MAG: hypothetical protein JNJ75_00905 [Cyclobacteriaceae bacterium]|nr:hypothetical protein [Cyclobacteriaceae bacterium]
MKKGFEIAFAILILITSLGYSQKTDSCTVKLNDISGKYTGDCKGGLAHGKGTAKGKDSYAGEFVNGLPEGKGTYVYENGNTYTGYWTNGLKNGQGKFVYKLAGKEYVQKGYWKNGDYTGISNPDEAYRITNQSGIDNCTIKKLEGSDLKIKISIIGAMLKSVPMNLEVTSTSGQVRQQFKDFVVYRYLLPNTCTVSYMIKTSGGGKFCRLSFDILQAGDYEVVITTSQ